MKRAIEEAFIEAAGQVFDACPACGGPVPWVEEHRQLVRAPNGVVLELSCRYDPASKVMVDMNYCGACGQSVNGSGRGVGGPANGGLVGSIVRIVPGHSAEDSDAARASWAVFLRTWLAIHGHAELADRIGGPWSGTELGDAWLPPGDAVRELDLGDRLVGVRRYRRGR